MCAVWRSALGPVVRGVAAASWNPAEGWCWARARSSQPRLSSAAVCFILCFERWAAFDAEREKRPNGQRQLTALRARVRECAIALEASGRRSATGSALRI